MMVALHASHVVPCLCVPCWPKLPWEPGCCPGLTPLLQPPATIPLYLCLESAAGCSNAGTQSASSSILGKHHVLQPFALPWWKR